MTPLVKTPPAALWLYHNKKHLEIRFSFSGVDSVFNPQESTAPVMM